MAAGEKLMRRWKRGVIRAGSAAASFARRPAEEAEGDGRDRNIGDCASVVIVKKGRLDGASLVA